MAPSADHAPGEVHKMPPLIHPATLAAAAAQCSAFGGDPELLNPAALAGALIQATMIGLGSPVASVAAALQNPTIGPPPGMENRAEVIPNRTLEPLPAVDNFALEAARRAALATCDVPKKPEKRPAPPPVSAPPPQYEPPPPTFSQSLPPLGGGLGDTSGVVMPPSTPLGAGPMDFTNFDFNKPLGGGGSLPGGPLSFGNNDFGNNDFTASTPKQPNLKAPPATPPPSMSPPPMPKMAGVSNPNVPSKEREAEQQAALTSMLVEEPGISKPPKEEKEEARCHLHRKPQLNCKVCRKIYYSTHDQERRVSADSAKNAEQKAKTGGMEDRKASGIRPAFEVSNKGTYNFNSMLRDQVLKSTYFKSLLNIDTFEGILDDLFQYCDSAEVYASGTTTTPSTLFCCLFRFFTLEISHDELMQLCDNKESPYARCAGLLYIRFGAEQKELWEWLGDYCLDDQEFVPSKQGNAYSITVGEYVEALIMDERYFDTALPRVPVGIKKKLEEKVAPLTQYRRRNLANKRELDKFRVTGTRVEANSHGDWLDGKIVSLNESVPSRVMVKVKLEDGKEEVLHLGKVILKEAGGDAKKGRDRSRSPRRGRGTSPDWTRDRGKPDQELIDELRARVRERAVCHSGKDYARRPIGFMSGLAMKRDMGIGASVVREEDLKHVRLEGAERISRMPKNFKPAPSTTAMTPEERAKQQEVYEKYAVSKPAAQATQDLNAVEGPDMLRLG